MITTRRHIALVAHDNKKVELLRWAEFNRGTLSDHQLYATGTTGTMIEYELGLPVTRFLSGHDPDVKALLRIATVWNVPMACNVATADLIISSPLLSSDYERARPDHSPRAWDGTVPEEEEAAPS